MKKFIHIRTYHTPYFFHSRLKETLEFLRARLLAELSVTQDLGRKNGDFPFSLSQHTLQSVVEILICRLAR